MKGVSQLECKKFERQIQAYIDGRHNCSEREAFFAPTPRCPEWSALLDDLAALDAVPSA